MFVISTININGLNSKVKQQQVVDFMKFKKIDILLIQEHNIRNFNAIGDVLKDYCYVSINLAVCLKGGTAILISRKLTFHIFSEEKSADSRILSIKLKIYNQFLHIVNVYAHSGSRGTERDDLFNNELLYYLRNSLRDTYVDGDWNCILSKRDTNSDNAVISKSLLNVVRSLNLKDIWSLKNRHVEYTYVRQDFGSRIDRAYVKDLSKYVSNVKTINVNFSDHSCLISEFKFPEFPQRGKYYWKLNVSLVYDQEVKDRFKVEWNRWCSNKYKFNDINEWWDIYVKREIKSFFIREGKRINDKKYGLIQYLEYSLNRKYNQLNISGTLQYSEVKLLKDRIDDLKNEILEGVKIRSRIKEQEEGEKVSAYLIKQQVNIKSQKLITSIKTEANIMENLEPNIILKDKDSIVLYIKKYYQKLYKKEDFDEEYQEGFLKFVTKVLSDEEQKLLMLDITQNEVFNAIKDMNLNRAPGIDGIPVEFYIQFWDIIKDDITEVIKNIVKGTLLKEHQRKAIITLIPKDGDLNLLKTWRPVSLICCDIKIVAKILAKRIGPLLYSLISENQYCIIGKSIIDCNNKIRDIMYYAGANKSSGAIINVDWEKAFDRVNWEFLVKIMYRMRFPATTIKWIMTLYTNIQSLVLINGNFTSTFDICRGVRQGCPLSMMMFIIFQNPLYLAIEHSNKIKPFVLPDSSVIEIGYADDTNVMVSDEKSLTEIFKVLNDFEKATNSIINISKTRIYGFGKWESRENWPIQNLKVEKKYFNTLGIYFSVKYNTALSNMWKHIYEKIKVRLSLIKNRRFTLYQKTVIINCLIASKIWYVAHVYPIPKKYITMFNTEIIRFIWGGNGKPIKRTVLCNKKENGGLGLLDIEKKAKSIFVSTMIKSFLLSNRNDLIRYYLSNKIGYIFNLRSASRNLSMTNTPYYKYAIDMVKKCKDHKKFPNIKSKDIYELLVPKVIPNIVSRYAFNWPNIWKYLNFRYMNIDERNIMFKFIYEILPTKKKIKANNNWSISTL